MLSFVIPAHNEEQHLPATLSAAREAGAQCGEPFEIVVVSDSSTDRTEEIAREHGARVLSVAHRQIAATRNSGAREARGEVLFFVDADTLPNAAAVRAGIEALRGGAVGGGCIPVFDGVLPLWARLMYPAFVVGMRTFRFVGGCFLFCTREAFEAIGGFPERYFAAEEVGFIRSLKGVGRFVIPRPTVVTSGRKLRAHSGRELLVLAGRRVVCGRRLLEGREGLAIWYGPRSED